MAYEDDDSREFIGTDNKIKAAPRATPAAKPDVLPAVAAELAKPEKPYHALERGKPGSHPKHAIERPRKEYEAAKTESEAALVEYQAASIAFKAAEKIEGAAIADWIALNPPPDADTVYRQHVARDLAIRAERVAKGLPPVEPPKVSANRSRIDTLAAQRPRQTAQMPSAPLRSPVVRRAV